VGCCLSVVWTLPFVVSIGDVGSVLLEKLIVTQDSLLDLILLRFNPFLAVTRIFVKIY